MIARINTVMSLVALVGCLVVASPPARGQQPAAPVPPAPAAEPKKADAQPENKPVADTSPAFVKISTSMGDLVVELNREKAPISVANYLQYVDKKFYDNTIFHRVIPNFMIQGGGFGADMDEKPADKPIKNEWENGLKNVRGSVAMARRPAPDSATAQFYINVVDNAALDGRPNGAGYAVFGKVIAGMDVVDKIRAVKTARSGNHENVPVEPVLIKSATRLTAEEAAKLAGAPAPKVEPKP